MTSKVKKSLQKVVDIIVAVNGCENCFDEDAGEFKPWEVIDLLREFADPENVQDIRNRNHQDEVISPKWNVGDEVQLQRRWWLSTYPDDLQVETTYKHREEIHTVKIEHYFWVNLLDNPWSESNYVGWKYVVRFIDDSMPGQYLVSEDSLFISEE